MDWIDDASQRKELLKLIADKIMSEIEKQKFDCRPNEIQKGMPFWEYQNWKIYYNSRGPDDVRFIFEIQHFEIQHDLFLRIHVNTIFASDWRHHMFQDIINLDDPDLFEKSAKLIIEAIKS